MQNAQTPSSTSDNLPEVLRPFFWDVDFQKLCIGKDSFSIISRLLELGDETATRILLKLYTAEEIVSVLRMSRSLSRRSRNFWITFFDADDRLCTPRRYPTPYGNCSRD
jgi:hypothetical protein